MSRTSPGRYAIHEFARNVFDVQIDDGRGKPLRVERPGTSQSDVTGHSGTVRVRYKVLGDQGRWHLPRRRRHARPHQYARRSDVGQGYQSCPVRVTFDMARGWRAATQLLPTSDPQTFTGPNLEYLMDSPAELSSLTLRYFQCGAGFSLAVHHEGSDAEAEPIGRRPRTRGPGGARGVRRAARPSSTPYTFIADFLPYASTTAWNTATAQSSQGRHRC